MVFSVKESGMMGFSSISGCVSITHRLYSKQLFLNKPCEASSVLTPPVTCLDALVAGTTPLAAVNKLPISYLETWLKRYTQPNNDSLLIGTATDFARTRSD